MRGLNTGYPVVLTDGQAVYGHVITKFSGIGRFTYPWCSSGALCAPELRYHEHLFQLNRQVRLQPFISLVIELLDRSKGLDKNRFFVKIRFVVYSLVLYKNSST